ncbi:MAG: nucleotidyltransferase substrate binding protein [Planctomycetota bacterium]|jgi:nucleotidyltransferase substrate binding protein (TIGR01987 family)|nr:nucleotidyltransferase substrate binding protein [Planctomycetota bacterium]
MSNSDEVRWQQRLENFRKALTQLDEACEKESYTDLERAGLVQMFQFTFELAWKTLKDLLFYEGYDIKTPREVIRKSFEVEYLDESDTETFLDGLEKRNLLSHTYEEQIAAEAVRLIKGSYVQMLRRVFATLERKQAE